MSRRAMSPSACRRLRIPGCRPEPSRYGGALRRGLLLASLTSLPLLTVLTGTAAAQDVATSSDPYVEFTLRDSRVNENAGTHHVQLRLSSTRPFDITVRYVLNYNITRAARGIPTADSDYTALSGRVTVSAGAATATIPVTIIDDVDQEGDEVLVLSLADGVGYRLGRLDALDHLVTIRDNEQLPVVTFSSQPTDVGEGAGTHNATLNLSPAPNKNITVRYRVGGSRWGRVPPATSGSDFEPLSGSVTVLAGATTATIPVTIIDDGAHEGVERFGLILHPSAGYTTSNRTSDYRSISIIDDDPQVDVSFVSASQHVVEGAGTRDVTVNLTPAPTADITLGYSVGGTATADADYTALSGTVAVSAGAATATIPVAIVDDSDPEGEETVVLTLTGTEGHRKVRPNTHTLTIAASDGPPTMTAVSFATASQRAGDESGTRNVTVNLNPAPASNITLNYTVGGTATPGSDYTVLSGTLPVTAGAVMATIPVTLLADNVQEDRETVVLTLAPGTGYELASPGTHTLTFGTVPTVTFPTLVAGTSESVGTYQVPVHLSPPPTSGITVNYGVGGGIRPATSGSDYEPLTGTLSVPAGAAKVSIPVMIIDDSVEDSRETVLLWLMDEPGYTVGSQYDNFLLVITNHESGDLEGRVQARLDAAVTDGDTASANLWRRALAAVRDEAPPSGLARLTKADAQALAVDHAGRGDIELASLWAEIAEVIGSGTTDPPPPTPEVTIAADAASVAEGGSASFTLTADPVPAAPLEVTVTVAASGDYGVIAGEKTYTIPTTGSYTLTLATDNDGADEADGSVSVTVDAGDGYTVGTPSSGTVAIRDDDTTARVLPAAHPLVKYASLVESFYDRISARNQHGNGAAGGWNKRFLKAMGHPEYVDYPQAAVTVADATRIWNHGGPVANTAWNGTVEAVTYAEQYFAGQVTPPPTPDPEVTIAAGAGVTEGTAAAFTVTADRAPAADLAVTLNVAEAQGSDFVAASDEGARTVTILAGATAATLTVATDNDGVDEPDGSVTATVQAGTGYTVGAASSATVAIEDDDEPAPQVVDKTLPAAHPLVKHGSVVKRFHDRLTARNQHGNGAAGGWNKRFLKAMGHPDYVDYPQAAVTVADATKIWNHGGPGANTAWDGTVEAVTYAEQYFAGQVPTPTPDPAPTPEITIAAGAGVTEGGSASFVLTADPVPAAPLEVTVTVAASGDYGIAAGERTVRVPTTGSTMLTLATDNDDRDEPDGSVTATVTAGDGYTVGSASSGTVAIADNDAVTGRPMVSVDDATAREGETMQFAVRLSAPLKHILWVRVRVRESNPVSARAGRDFRMPWTPEMVWFLPGETVGRYGVRIHDDSHDDGGETFEVKVVSVMNGAAGIADGVAVGTIENDDPLPAAYLARFGRTVAEQALDGIAGRMSADRTPGMQSTLAGQSLSFDPAASGQPVAGATPSSSGTMPANREAAPTMAGIARRLGADASAPVSASAGPGTAADPFGAQSGDSRFGTPSLQSRSMTAGDALLGSSFSLTGRKDGVGGSLAFWGRASQGSFDGAERGDGTDITLDGTVTAGMLGADYARGKWLVGLALTQSWSEGNYAAIGGDPCPDTDEALCDGDVEASLTAAIPYAAFKVLERLKLWGAAGYGIGEVTLKTMYESYSADTSWIMAAAGLRGDLLEAPKEGSGPALALTSDGLWARTSSDKTRDLAATDSDVTRLRLGLEGSYRMALEGDGHFTPRLEIGARHDGGDAETGFGVEIGGGLQWADPGLGLSLDVSGRTLLAHENDDLKDWGVSASLAFDLAPATQRGPSFSLRQDFGGQAQGGLDALFAPAPLEDRTGSEAASRWAMEAAYGFPAFGGRFTGSPHVGLGLATGARDYSVGWRLAPEAATAPDLSFGVRVTRRESDAQAAEHAVGFEASLRW